MEAGQVMFYVCQDNPGERTSPHSVWKEECKVCAYEARYSWVGFPGPVCAQQGIFLDLTSLQAGGPEDVGKGESECCLQLVFPKHPCAEG